MQDDIDRLTRMFEQFPGIGPRQAWRFVHHLLRSSPAARREIADAIRALGGSVRSCKSCYRYFAGSGSVCATCANPNRDAALLAVVSSDADLDALERSGSFRGRYFVFGGTMPLAAQQTSVLRGAQLLESIGKRVAEGLQEVILAFPANPEGDATADHVRATLADTFPSLTVTALGRGLSTGSELEYADPDTLRSALESRR